MNEILAFFPFGIGAKVGPGEGVPVGPGVWRSVGDEVGEEVGEGVGPTTEATVGGTDGEGVGRGVEPGNGANVGVPVVDLSDGDAIGALDGLELLLSDPNPTNWMSSKTVPNRSLSTNESIYRRNL